MKCITADYIFDGITIHKNAGIMVDPNGVIAHVFPENGFDKLNFMYYPGLLTPGFINTHCHLELSHLKNKFSTGTGLISFINSVVRKREVEEEEIMQAIANADLEMHTNGIVAVGDISNKKDTIKTKINSKIKYYNFIECFDFLQEDTSDQFLNGYLEVYKEFGSLRKSLVPHAPYTVSRNLFSKINSLNSANNVISIHNQELADEDLLFINKTGGFEQFFNQFGFSIDQFKPIGKTSIHYTLENLNPNFQVIYVHNTCMEEVDIAKAIEINPNSYFATCPNANLFIENKLPKYSKFQNQKANICIGTDSLTSNWKLCILEEMKTIQKYQSDIPLLDILTWATLNGAKALKMDSDLGSIEVGKSPGINWIQEVHMDNGTLKLSTNSSVYKLM